MAIQKIYTKGTCQWCYEEKGVFLIDRRDARMYKEGICIKCMNYLRKDKEQK